MPAYQTAIDRELTTACLSRGVPPPRGLNAGISTRGGESE